MRKVKILGRAIVKQGLLPQLEEDSDFENRINEFIKDKDKVVISGIDSNRIIITYDN
jgi:hypothetical protein